MSTFYRYQKRGDGNWGWVDTGKIDETIIRERMLDDAPTKEEANAFLWDMEWESRLNGYSMEDWVKVDDVKRLLDFIYGKAE